LSYYTQLLVVYRQNGVIDDEMLIRPYTCSYKLDAQTVAILQAHWTCVHATKRRCAQ